MDPRILQARLRRRTRGCEYWTGGEEEPGRDEKLGSICPRNSAEAIGPQQTLARMIAEGEIDALHTARTPSTFATRPEAVKRSRELRRSRKSVNYRRPRIFPIMHTVVIRRELYRANAGFASRLQGLRQAQRRTYENLATTMALTPAPVAGSACRGSAPGARRGLVGPTASSPTVALLETFLRYHHEQGLSSAARSRRAFAPETLATFACDSGPLHGGQPHGDPGFTWSRAT